MATDGACAVLARGVVASEQLRATMRLHSANIMRGQTAHTFRHADTIRWRYHGHPQGAVVVRLAAVTLLVVPRVGTSRA